MDSIFGIRVIESPLIQPVAKLQVHPNCPMTDEGRDKMNAWLLEMFGKEEVAYIFNLPAFHGIVMNPKHAAMIRNYTA